jgi:hypothetical protein
MKSTNLLSSLDQASVILDQENLHLREMEQDEESLCRLLRMKIGTLTMLGTSLASPAEESSYDEQPRANLQRRISAAHSELLPTLSVVEPPQNASGMSRFFDNQINEGIALAEEDSKKDQKGRKKQHNQSWSWICLLKGPRLLPTDPKEPTRCVFCMRPDPTEDHFQECYRLIEDCLKREIKERTFFRSDHLRQHAKNFHNCDLSETALKRWKVAGPVKGAGPLPH